LEDLVGQVLHAALDIVGQPVFEDLGSVLFWGKKGPDSGSFGLWKGWPYLDCRPLKFGLAIKKVPLLPPNRCLGSFHSA
jgi:hypothetical protein